jgi:hypothetical protein
VLYREVVEEEESDQEGGNAPIYIVMFILTLYLANLATFFV